MPFGFFHGIVEDSHGSQEAVPEHMCLTTMIQTEMQPSGLAIDCGTSHRIAHSTTVLSKYVYAYVKKIYIYSLKYYAISHKSFDVLSTKLHTSFQVIAAGSNIFTYEFSSLDTSLVSAYLLDEYHKLIQDDEMNDVTVVYGMIDRSAESILKESCSFEEVEQNCGTEDQS